MAGTAKKKKKEMHLTLTHSLTQLTDTHKSVEAPWQMVVKAVAMQLLESSNSNSKSGDSGT